MKRAQIAILIITLILIIDQAVKLYVKSNFLYGESVHILGWTWAQIRFAENEGIAFGLNWGGITGKYILSIFRIILVAFLIRLLYKLIQRRESKGFIAAFSLIIAGAIGNILDSIYFGLIFSKSEYNQIASFLPEEGGYAPILQGKVVDMFYFPMIQSKYPDWFPFKAGEYFEFFNAIFNVADASIFVGVTCLLIFYRKKLFKPSEQVQPVD